MRKGFIAQRLGGPGQRCSIVNHSAIATSSAATLFVIVTNLCCSGMLVNPQRAQMRGSGSALLDNMTGRNRGYENA
jgi:hypothetical protein